MTTKDLTQEEMDRAREILAREERRKETQRIYREGRKNDPEIQAKQKEYNSRRREQLKLVKAATTELVCRHREEYEEILDGMRLSS